ncbi:Epoxide hydrolase [Apiospora phragmitis]|uniref:Epoxide hydrolase n=1 Tax=Apiospora phragmitis TaxID=2905665 RepID=A0ABR1T449_9PEZI
MYGTFTDTTSIARVMAGDAQQPDDAAATAGQNGSAHPPDEEVKPYQLHVSTKYIDLTQQKLEITRLPHEQSPPNSDDWWEPKPLVEPLVDFWLEQYDWRSEEAAFNELPQFRTGFTIPNAEAPVRIHFIHARSSHENALPLLLIPPFPLTSLSFAHLLQSFTEPEDAAINQPFHLVIPSLPGLGFSDALPNNTPAVSTSGEILNSLMNRLEYSHYLVTNAASASGSPAQIDWKLASYLATQHPNSCVGTHFISPPLAKPRLKETPIAWAKWSIAKFFSAPIMGYHKDDFSALKRNPPSEASKNSSIAAQFGLNHQLGLLQEPNTLAYALCDSPTGLLVFVLKYLKLLAPNREFTQAEIINFTQLAWLPGPEAAMRFWAHSAHHPEITESPKNKPAKKLRPRVAITVFLGDEVEASGFESVQDEEAQQILPQAEIKESYACPGWAKAKYKVVYAHRASGKAGLLAWERPELIVSGVRSLAKEIVKLDSRLKPSPGPITAPLEQVVAGHDGGDVPAQTEDPATANNVLMSPEIGPQPPTPATEAPPLLTALSSDSALLAPIPSPRSDSRPQGENSEDTRVPSDNEAAPKYSKNETAKYPDERKRLIERKSEETLAERPSPGRMYPLH